MEEIMENEELDLDEEFNLVDFLGIEGLYITERYIEQSQLPEGLYVAHVEEDYSETYVDIEYPIYGGIVGSLITKEEIDYGRYPIDIMDHLGCKASIKKFNSPRWKSKIKD